MMNDPMMNLTRGRVAAVRVGTIALEAAIFRFLIALGQRRRLTSGVIVVRRYRSQCF
jgi:hypothetical protein